MLTDDRAVATMAMLYNMNPIINLVIDDIARAQPLTFKAVYPKRILPPAGYLNPKLLAASLWGHLRVGYEPEMQMLPHVTAVTSALIMTKFGVPTYFVQSEFAQAVAHTEPPTDFTFSEILWPLDAMLFVLPTDFALKYFGFLCPFICVTRSPKGVYPDSLAGLPACDWPVSAINKIDITCDRINIVYPVYSEQTMPVDYTGSYPLSMRVDSVADAPFEDATLMEMQHRPLDSLPSAAEAADLPHGDAEQAFTRKVQSFAIKLMLALTAMPEAVATGVLARHGKVKKGNRRVDDLWNPNLIGWQFKAERPADNGSGHGTHASPRMHWRRGVLRKQPYGPKPWTAESPRRPKWIPSLLINAEPSV